MFVFMTCNFSSHVGVYTHMRVRNLKLHFDYLNTNLHNFIYCKYMNLHILEQNFLSHFVIRLYSL